MQTLLSYIPPTSSSHTSIPFSNSLVLQGSNSSPLWQEQCIAGFLDGGHHHQLILEKETLYASM